MPNESEAKSSLDKIIRKSRVHFYKPIQIAEILFHDRTNGNVQLDDLESYRNISKKWRDEITVRLIGRRSTSSQRYQDNLFEANAMDPAHLAVLGEIDKRENGVVEAYVYKSLQQKLSSVYGIAKYIKTATPDTFSLSKLLSLIEHNPGLRRSIDKIYEITIYALFSTIVRALKAQVTLEVLNKDSEVLKDFERFVEMVLGITAENTKLVFPAALYRVGVTNAADRGLDMWANFGAAVQVKHLTLKPILVEEIAENIQADKIVIVCLNSEKEAIETLLSQVGWGERIQGIITVKDLENWYKLSLSPKYRVKLGSTLLSDLTREFEAEFPSSEEIKPFLEERGYSNLALSKDWKVK